MGGGGGGYSDLQGRKERGCYSDLQGRKGGGGGILICRAEKGGWGLF